MGEPAAILDLPGPAGGSRFEVVRLRLDQVQADPRSSGRHRRNLEQLRQSIAIHGCLEPPGVKRTPAGFELTFGFGRFVVLTSIYEPASVHPFVLVPAEASAAELRWIENEVRSSLTPADRCEQMAELVNDRTVAAIAPRLGVSEQHARNLARIRRQLIPELWTIFQRLDREAKIGPFLRIAAMPARAQMAAWCALQEPETQPRRSGARLARRILASAERGHPGRCGGFWAGVKACARAISEGRTLEEPWESNH